MEPTREQPQARNRDRDGGFFEPSLTFLRVRGIPIGAHWSWLIVAALIVWALGAQLFPRTYPGLSGTTYWLMAVIAAVLFFGSVLLHELGHALRASHEGLHIEGITLWLFGGVARFRSLFPSAGVEFGIAIAGPAISLVLAIAFGLLAWAGGQLGWPEPVRGVTDYLARINVIVLAFNLVPALPLDGGRVLRAWLWHRQRDFVAATLSAARAGRIFGMLLIGVGVLGLFTGAGTGGIWIAFIGWFLMQAAAAEGQHAVVRHAFSGLSVRDLMTPDPESVPPEITVAELLERVGGPRGHSTYPVVDRDELVGMVSLRMATRVRPDERAQRRVGDIMLPRDELPTLAPDADVDSVLERLQEGPGRALVVTDGHARGILSRSDLARAFERRKEEGIARAPTRSAGIVVWLVVGLAMALAAGYLYHPPIAVVSAGPAIDVAEDITIRGVRTDPVDGAFLLTSVELSQPNGLGALYALVHPGRDIVPLSSVIPEGVDPQRFSEQQRAVFEQSRLIAAIAAARAAGMDVSISGSGAEVVAIVPGSPAASVLERGDVIVGVEGRRIDVAQGVGDEVSAQPAGTRFQLTVERDGSTRRIEVRSARLEQTTDAVVGIGVLLQTRDFAADLPFDISFEQRAIGGPSAGVAYALAISDLLDPANLAAGRTIAATGTVSIDGDVGRVDGVAKKARGARDAGADLFLVPRADVGSAREAGIPVRGVRTLAEAISLLRAEA